MRKLIFLGLSVIYALATTLCSYTPLETQYITNKDNYIELEVVVSSAEYHEDEYSYLYINLSEFSRYRDLTGKNPVNYDQETLQNTIIEIKIVSQNAKLLKERGFFDNIKSGDKITIKTTCWLYEDVNHHYLAALSCGETTYLTFEEGFDGVSNDTYTFKKFGD